MTESRPKDTNLLAREIVDIVTGEKPDQFRDKKRVGAGEDGPAEDADSAAPVK